MLHATSVQYFRVKLFHFHSFDSVQRGCKDSKDVKKAEKISLSGSGVFREEEKKIMKIIKIDKR